MTWVYKKGDMYDLDQLLKFKEFFEENLFGKIAEVQKAKKFMKYGLPSWRTQMLRLQMGVEDAEKNLMRVNEAIKDIKKREKL